MVFYVIVVTFQMTALMNDFTSIAMDDSNVNKIHTNYRNRGWYIMHPHVYVMNNMYWMIEIWMENQLVSDNNCNMVNLH